MNEEIDQYDEYRKKRFWEYEGLVIIIAGLMLLLIVGCQTAPTQSGIREPYNLTSMGNASGYIETIQLVNNTLMFGWLGTMALITIFVIAMASFMVSTADPKKSFLASIFIVSITGVLFLIIGIVPSYVVFGSFAILALTIVSTIFNR